MLRVCWLLVPLAALFGFWLTRAERAENILCTQVERTTAGSIQARYLALGICLCVAVLLVGLAFQRNLEKGG
ncbi:DUF1538 family protein [Desulfonatronum parangueonense]